MTDTANIWRYTSTTDAGGGSTTAWTLDGTTPVMLAVPSAAEREAAAQQGIEVTHVAVMPLDANVSRGDRLVIGDVTIEVVSAEVGTHSTVKRARGRQEPWDEPL